MRRHISRLLLLCSHWSFSKAAFLASTSSKSNYKDKYYRGGDSNSSRDLHLSKPNIPLEHYDFSSQNGWDDFYTVNSSSSSSFEFEWHASIPHAHILEQIRSKQTVLLVGNGNSRLPRDIADEVSLEEVSVTCMDYSRPCIDALQKLHGDDYSNVEFLCGDVTDLSQLLEGRKYDVVVDKGLMDALMCSDGWEGHQEVGKVRQYWRNVGKVLAEGGKIVLMLYKVSKATREFLEEVGEEMEVNWVEDEDKGDGRVSFLIGTRCRAVGVLDNII